MASSRLLLLGQERVKTRRRVRSRTAGVDVRKLEPEQTVQSECVTASSDSVWGRLTIPRLVDE